MFCSIWFYALFVYCLFGLYFCLHQLTFWHFFGYYKGHITVFMFIPHNNGRKLHYMLFMLPLSEDSVHWGQSIIVLGFPRQVLILRLVFWISWRIMFPNKLVTCITNVKWRNSILFNVSAIVCCAVVADVWPGSAHSACVPSKELGETPRGTQRCVVWSGTYHAGSSRSYKAAQCVVDIRDGFRTRFETPVYFAFFEVTIKI